MKIDIDKLSEADLIDLNRGIVERLRFLQQMRAHATMLEFRIGDRVRAWSARCIRRGRPRRRRQRYPAEVGFYTCGRRFLEDRIECLRPDFCEIMKSFVPDPAREFERILALAKGKEREVRKLNP